MHHCVEVKLLPINQCLFMTTNKSVKMCQAQFPLVSLPLHMEFSLAAADMHETLTPKSNPFISMIDDTLSHLSPLNFVSCNLKRD